MEHPDLSKFPPRLQKLAKFVSDSTEYKVTLSEYCREAGLSYDSIRHGIARAKAKGNDFNALVDRIHHEKLTSFKPRIYKALIREGEKGNCKAIEIFFKLTGDLKPDRVESNVTSNSLTVCLVGRNPFDRVSLPSQGNGHPGEGPGEDAGVDPCDS